MDKLGFGDLVGGVAGEDGAVAGMSYLCLLVIESLNKTLYS